MAWMSSNETIAASDLLTCMVSIRVLGQSQTPCRHVDSVAAVNASDQRPERKQANEWPGRPAGARRRHVEVRCTTAAERKMGVSVMVRASAERVQIRTQLLLSGLLVKYYSLSDESTVNGNACRTVVG